jgi:hypothetical protein
VAVARPGPSVPNSAIVGERRSDADLLGAFTPAGRLRILAVLDRLPP